MTVASLVNYRDRDLIFGMYTQTMKDLQITPMSTILTMTIILKIDILDNVIAGGIHILQIHLFACCLIVSSVQVKYVFLKHKC